MVRLKNFKLNEINIFPIAILSLLIIFPSEGKAQDDLKKVTVRLKFPYEDCAGCRTFVKIQHYYVGDNCISQLEPNSSFEIDPHDPSSLSGSGNGMRDITFVVKKTDRCEELGARLIWRYHFQYKNSTWIHDDEFDCITSPNKQNKQNDFICRGGGGDGYFVQAFAREESSNHWNIDIRPTQNFKKIMMLETKSKRQ